MKSVDEYAAELVQRIIQRFGYLVVASSKELKIGHIEKGMQLTEGGDFLDHPFCVLARTDLEELKEQSRFIGLEVYEDSLEAPFFYRITTD